MTRAILGVCLVLGLALSAAGAAHADAIADVRAGVAAQQQGDLDGAIRLYDRAIAAGSLTPLNLAKAYADRCNAYAARFMAAAATADCAAALRLDPNDGLAYIDRGNIELQRAAYAPAIADYTAGFRLGVRDAAAFNNRGTAELRLGRYTDAIADFGAALALQPGFATAYKNRAYARLDLGQWHGAADDFRAALSRDPGDAYTVLWLHITRANAHEDDRAELAANAARLDPARWPAALVATFLGRRSADAVAAQAAAARDPRQACEAAFFLGERALETHRFDEARRRFAAATARCPAVSPEARAAAALRAQGF